LQSFEGIGRLSCQSNLFNPGQIALFLGCAACCSIKSLPSRLSLPASSPTDFSNGQILMEESPLKNIYETNSSLLTSVPSLYEYIADKFITFYGDKRVIE